MFERDGVVLGCRYGQNDPSTNPDIAQGSLCQANLFGFLLGYSCHMRETVKHFVGELAREA